jgi:hypothetical protein
MDSAIQFKIAGYTSNLLCQRDDYLTAFKDYCKQTAQPYNPELQEAFRAGWFNALPTTPTLFVPEAAKCSDLSERYIRQEITRYQVSEGRTGLRAALKRGAYEIEKPDYDVWMRNPRRSEGHKRYTRKK